MAHCQPPLPRTEQPDCAGHGVGLTVERRGWHRAQDGVARAAHAGHGAAAAPLAQGPAGEKRLNTPDDVFGSTLLASGLGSVFALEDKPGATNVVLKHLKPEAPEASHRRDGRHGITHDHATGTTTLGAAVDLSVGAYLEAIAPEGSAGTTAKDVSLACLGIAVPDEAGSTWVCRQLNSRVAKNDAVKGTTGICTRDRAAPDRWVWTGAGRRERELEAEAAERLAQERVSGL